MKNSKGINTSAIVFICLFVISACSKVDMTVYEHKPSAAFYQSFDDELPILADYKKENILFVTDIRQVTPAEFVIWLGLYTKHDGEHIEIKDVALHGALEKKNTIYQTLTLNIPVVETSLLKASTQLFRFQANEFEGTVDGTFTLKVNYLLNSTNGEINFVIKRSKESFSVFST